jgi:transposase-like protein
MKITITLHCPDCQSTKVKKNGKKISKKQNYLCKNCGRQFIGDHALRYKGCHSCLIQKILTMPVRGIGIRDIAEIKKNQHPESIVGIGQFTSFNPFQTGICMSVWR